MTDYYAFRSEYTTGVSQKEIIDSATHAFDSRHTSHTVYYKSAMEFAVVMNLRLYVDIVLQADWGLFQAKMVGVTASHSCILLSKPL